MIRVKQVKVKVENNNIIDSIIKKLKIRKEDLVSYNIVKQSLDARNKDEIFYVYEVDCVLRNENKIRFNNDISITPNMDYILPNKGNLKLEYRPVIVGSGPSGLFCGYLLAQMGYKPLIIERGEKVEERVKTVNSFWENNKLNINSNVQFGEGGAGTFSDGKLNTLVKDVNNRGRFIFNKFVECGASNEILYSYKPHIGTDVLVEVIKNLREKIISMGGEFRYNTCLTDIEINNNEVSEIIVNNNEVIKTNIVVLAIGHSSRDTFKMLNNKNITMEAKSFAVGFRVMHSQKMIDESQYGEYSNILSKATYKLTYQASNNRGVYSFCMCPGGYVVNASSEENKLAINGMSYSDRGSSNSNSAIVVTVNPRDFGTNPMDGIEFQRTLEEKAYMLGNGNIPIQLLGDYKENKISTKFGSVKPLFKGNYTFSNLNSLLPDDLNISMKEAFINFGKKIKGFDNNDIILAGIESRTSSPIRIIRDDLFESNIKGLYPCGEGCGYAGGITSAAIDGIKVAEKIIEKYSSI